MSRSSKPVSKLTQSDLRACPVWEYIAEPVGRQTEEWVRPRRDITNLTVRSLSTGFNVVIAATLTFRDGSLRPGFCHALTEPMLRRLFDREERSDLAVLSYLTPVAFGKSGTVDFRVPRNPTIADLKRLYAKLGRSRTLTFPVSFSPTIHVGKGIIATGTIPAFYWSAQAMTITT